jgi:hypothetical protein
MPHVDVLPLQPPFTGTVMKITFQGVDKQLAVSRPDFLALQELLGDIWTDRIVTISSVDGQHIRVEVQPS